MDHPYHRLKDLEVDMNNSGKIRVRVSRIWNHCLPNGTVAGINLILVDEFVCYFLNSLIYSGVLYNVDVETFYPLLN